MKIGIVIGTRPEIIKMASIIDEINQRGIDSTVIHTGQHYDKEMSDQFFIDLELPTPDYNIGVGSGNHGQQTASMIEGIEKIVEKENINILLVQGDTNAVLAGALVASKLHIPVGHVEAGLRSYDKTMPEEINRMVADVCTQMYFVPTTQSAINLTAEGIKHHNIYITGNTVVDACFRNLKISQKTSKIFQKLEINPDEEKILTVTLHRAENVDNKERITSIVESLIELNEMTILFPVHPRTRKMLNEFGLLDKIKEQKHIKLIKPVGYLDFLYLLSESFLIITDSGGLQEEAITLNVPALTLRYNTERPETVTAGGNILVGADKEKILTITRNLLQDTQTLEKMRNAHNPYGEGNSAKITIDAILEEHKNGRLKMTSPEDIMSQFERKITTIHENITVKQFEEKNNAIITSAYKNNTLTYADNNTNLKDLTITYQEFIS